MLFLQADARLPLATGEAGCTPEDAAALKALWGSTVPAQTLEPPPAQTLEPPPAVQALAGKAGEGFDVVSCMFALHYFCDSDATLNAVAANVGSALREGGFFVGCCFDGEAVAAFLQDTPQGGAREDPSGLYTIRRQYGGDQGPRAPFPPQEKRPLQLGQAIDVRFATIGNAHREYLVPFPTLRDALARQGVHPVEPAKAKAMGLPNGEASGMFASALAASGTHYALGAGAARDFSFLNRYFVFQKDSNRVVVEQQALPTAATAPAPAPTSAAAPAPAPTAAPAPTGAAPCAFFHKSELRDDLGLGDPAWRRWLSPFAPVPLTDLWDDSITYPNVEAALGAAKCRFACGRPDLCAPLFASAAIAASPPQAAWDASVVAGTAARANSRPEALAKAAGAPYREAPWAAQRDEVLRRYVEQRLQRDERGARIVAASSRARLRLVYYTTSVPGEWSGVVRADGRVEGANRYGEALAAASRGGAATTAP